MSSERRTKPGFFYNLGKLVGPMVRKGNWVLQAMTGSEADSLAAEERVGKDLAADMASSLALLPPEPWLDELGARLVACAKDKRRHFHFRLVESNTVNAFALPGGFIFIHRALVELCRRDADEVGFVLGHEMAHVIRRHAIERLIGNNILSAAVRAAPVGRVIGQVGRGLFQSAYSREQEFEADEVGARLAAAAKLDPGGGARLLERLGTALRGGSPSPGDYFASHPPIDERIQRLRRMHSFTRQR